MRVVDIKKMIFGVEVCSFPLTPDNNHNGSEIIIIIEEGEREEGRKRLIWSCYESEKIIDLNKPSLCHQVDFFLPYITVCVAHAYS